MYLIFLLYCIGPQMGNRVKLMLPGFYWEEFDGTGISHLKYLTGNTYRGTETAAKPRCASSI